IWLWIISVLLFFWPQGIAVIELSHRYPGEGGVYLWAKEEFGDFHGFLSGWCYWTNQMLYVPTVMLYFVGVSVYLLGPGHESLADNKLFALFTSLTLLALLTALNIAGLGVGKWINNVGAIGTGIAAAVLIGLGIVVGLRFGTHLSSAEFRIPANYGSVLNPFAVMLSLAIAGIGAAWTGGAARIPFVAGLDSYMPSWMGKIHPKYATPHAALIVQFAVSAVLVVINFAGGIHVQETFQRLLSLAVVLQLVPFLYMFAALAKFGWNSDSSGRYGRKTLLVSGVCGFVTTFLGI